ncbi:MAG: PilW family protein [bacterium]
MKLELKNKQSGFTIIELMVSLFITLTVIATFFKLYTNSIKIERTTAIRASVPLQGEQIMESISNAIRLIGLASDYYDYSPVSGSGEVILEAKGGVGPTNISFQFKSPYGGPVTTLAKAEGGSGACTFTVESTAALHSGLKEVVVISNSAIHVGQVTSVTGDVIITSGMSPSVDNCSVAFPEGTLITGPNNDFKLSYINSGSTTMLSLAAYEGGVATEDYVNFDSTKGPGYQIPFMVLQFLKEYQKGGNIVREWFSEFPDPATELKQVKAVRVGFVLVSEQERVRKKVASADAGITTEHCLFDSLCYSLNDQNKTAYSFRRLIYLRNYDYLAINARINRQ